jgi:hypothetical protein
VQTCLEAQVFSSSSNKFRKYTISSDMFSATPGANMLRSTDHQQHAFLDPVPNKFRKYTISSGMLSATPGANIIRSTDL